MDSLCPVFLCPQVTLIHSQMALADTELLPCVRQEVKEILLRKGVQLLLSTCKAPPARPLSPAEAWSLPTVRVSVAALSPRLSVQCPLSPVVLLQVCLGRAEAPVLTDFHVMEAAPSWLLLRTEYRWDPFVEWFKKHVKDST